MNPETLIRSELLKSGIESYTTLGDFEDEEFVLTVRTSNDREFFDVNRSFVSKNYFLMLQCFSTGGLLAAETFSSTVANLLESLYWNNDVVDFQVVGGSQLPVMGEYSGYSLRVFIAFN